MTHMRTMHHLLVSFFVEKYPGSRAWKLLATWILNQNYLTIDAGTPENRGEVLLDWSEKNAGHKTEGGGRRNGRSSD